MNTFNSNGFSYSHVCLFESFILIFNYRIKILFYSIIYLFSVFLFSCSPIKNSQYEKYSSLRYETNECSQNFNYSPSLSVYGSARFYKRGLNLIVEASQLKNMSLGDPLSDPLPIRFAEIAIYNSKNELVQCGVTNSTGDLKALDGASALSLPRIAGQYSIRVLARMNLALEAPALSPSKNSFKSSISVKEDIYTNEVHFISKTMTNNGTDDISDVNLLAYARQTDSDKIEGGAFNILNTIYTGYDYIRNNTGSVNIQCLSPKLNVYWKPGFNPFQYTYPDSDPSYLGNGSYYNKEDEKLFITGGRLGDLSIDVTNHFDDFVILHEFAHHVEHKCGQLLSPGGSHYILSRIDPRLAWTEGWANYFAAQVMTNSLSVIHPTLATQLTATGLSATWTYLFASKGFSDSLQNIGNGTGFLFDFKKAGNNPDSWQYGDYKGIPFDKVDASRYPAEGHFREGSISRGLYKLTNTCGTYCTSATPITFETIWKSMDKITGVGQSQYAFKGSHDVLEKTKDFVGTVTWNASYLNFNQAATSEALHLYSDGALTSSGINRWFPFGTNLSTLTSGACPKGLMYIEPRIDDPVLTATNSDQRYSNHFFTLDFNTLSDVSEINVEFTKQNSLGSSIEFDLLLFQENYFYNSDYYCSAFSNTGSCTTYTPQRTVTSDVVRSDRRSGSLSIKSIKDLTSLDKTKKYLLNIRAYTATKTSVSPETDYSYLITNQSGLKLCP